MTQRENMGIMKPIQSEDGDLLSASWDRPTPLNNSAKAPIFGPGIPVLPANPLDRPRIFQYKPGINLVIIPRYGYGLADFQTLRNLSAACQEVRLNIELIKREIRSLEWKIVPQRENDKSDYGTEVDEVQAFFENPDGNQLDFDSYTNALLEEVLVTDALTLYPNLAGDRLASLDLIDGTTIRPVLDYRGKVARPPAPGYVQVLYGLPAGFWTTDELIYRPMNASVNSPYGTSPIEFFILAINLAMRRLVSHVANYSEGNVPDALVGAPASWSQSQIDTWQQYWDALVAGNIKQQRRMHWVPRDGTGSGLPVYEFRKGDIDDTTVDEWMMRVACWAFGNSPQEFGLVGGEGLGGKGYGDAMENIQQRSMIVPVSQFLARNYTRVIHHWMRKPHLKFQWVGLDPAEDTLKQAQVDEIYLRTGVYDLGYVQERDGIPQEHRPSAPPQQSGDMLDVPDLGDGIKKFFRVESGEEDYAENAQAGRTGNES